VKYIKKDERITVDKYRKREETKIDNFFKKKTCKSNN